MHSYLRSCLINSAFYNSIFRVISGSCGYCPGVIVCGRMSNIQVAHWRKRRQMLIVVSRLDLNVDVLIFNSGQLLWPGVYWRDRARTFGVAFSSSSLDINGS